MAPAFAIPFAGAHPMVSSILPFVASRVCAVYQARLHKEVMSSKGGPYRNHATVWAVEVAAPFGNVHLSREAHHLFPFWYIPCSGLIDCTSQSQKTRQEKHQPQHCEPKYARLVVVIYWS